MAAVANGLSIDWEIRVGSDDSITLAALEMLGMIMLRINADY